MDEESRKQLQTINSELEVLHRELNFHKLIIGILTIGNLLQAIKHLI